jgi:hypothetical protein
MDEVVVSAASFLLGQEQERRCKKLPQHWVFFINFYEVNRGIVHTLHVPHECRKSTDQGSSSST